MKLAMMRLGPIVVLLSVSACSGTIHSVMSIRSSTNPSRDLANVSSFKIVPVAVSADQQAIEQRLVPVLRQVLESRGLTYNDMDPDVFVIATADTSKPDEVGLPHVISRWIPRSSNDWRHSAVSMASYGGLAFEVSRQESKEGTLLQLRHPGYSSRRHHHRLIVLMTEIWVRNGDTTVEVPWSGVVQCTSDEASPAAVAPVLIEELFCGFPLSSEKPSIKQFMWPSGHPEKRKPFD